MILQKVEKVTQLFPDHEKDVGVACIFEHEGKIYIKRIKISTCATKVNKHLRNEALYQLTKTLKEVCLDTNIDWKTMNFDKKLLKKARDLLIEVAINE